MNRKNRKKVTITDIAMDCKVSIATVSRVLSNSDYPVSPEVRNKILLSAESLGYSLKIEKQNKTQAIGIIVPSLQNSFFIQVVSGITQQALSMGFMPYIFCSQRNIQTERDAINHMIKNKIMGLLIESIDTNSKCLKNYISHGGKVCLFDCNFSETLKGAMLSKTDSLKSSRLAVNYLVEKGHKKIAVISSPLIKIVRKTAVTGCLQAMVDNNINFNINEDLFVAKTEEEVSMYEYNTGMMLAEEILDSGRDYTAILALNDLLAAGAIKKLQSIGLNIPKDISVIGIDDVPISKIVSPALTTVQVSSELKGKSACQILINSLIKNESECELNIDVNPKIIERDSVRNV